MSVQETVDVKSEDKPMGPFFVVWGGQAFSLLGSQLVQFSLVWYLTQRTGSATILAFATMMAILPQVFLSPVAGALVDRWNRRYVMMAADGLIALATILLAALFAFDAVQVWHIYLLMFIRAAGGAFHWPAMQASTSLMVPEKHLSRIAGLNQALFGAMQIIAPPLGALLLGVLPMQFILSIDVVTAALAIGPLFFILIPQPERDPAAEGADATSVLSDMADGFRFVWGWPGLFIIIIMAALINLLANPAFSLLPILVTDHFGGEAAQYATIESLFGVGMIIGGLLLSTWGGFKKRIVTAALALILMGIGTAVMGVTPANLFALAIASFILVGIANPIANGSLFATLQTVVPPDKQGRVFTLVLSGATAMSPIGLAIAGPVADAIGVQFWYVIAGAAIVLMGIAMFLIPAVYRLEDQFAEAADLPDEGVSDDLLADGLPAR